MNILKGEDVTRQPAEVWTGTPICQGGLAKVLLHHAWQALDFSVIGTCDLLHCVSQETVCIAQ